jgi:hypothetical protein
MATADINVRLDHDRIRAIVREVLRQQRWQMIIDDENDARPLNDIEGE